MHVVLSSTPALLTLLFLPDHFMFLSTIPFARPAASLTRSLACILLLGLAGCASQSASIGPPQSPPLGSLSFASLQHVRLFEPSPSTPRSGFALLLPGASGLTIFDDTHHYDRVARRLAGLGFAVAAIDYKPLYTSIPDAPDASSGGKIAFVTSVVVRDLQLRRFIQPGESGVLLAWSLGAEGAWVLASSSDQLSTLNLTHAFMFYPAVEEADRWNSSASLLVLAPALDDAVPLADVRAAFQRLNAPGLARLVVLPGAHHGFDVQSLTQPRTVRLLPLVGPSATFHYDQPSADRAWQLIRDSLPPPAALQPAHAALQS